MTNDEFNKAIDHIREVSLSTLLAKNANYAKECNDALHNFKVGAEFTGGTVAQAAWGYMTKHLVALYDKIMNNDFSDIDDLEEKCQDIINYTAIIYAIGKENNESRSRFYSGEGGSGCNMSTYNPTQLIIPDYNKEEE